MLVPARRRHLPAAIVQDESMGHVCAGHSPAEPALLTSSVCVVYIYSTQGSRTERANSDRRVFFRTVLDHAHQSLDRTFRISASIYRFAPP